MALILFRCPYTAFNVQQWLDDEPVPNSGYEAITCPACSRLHFVDRTTEKLLGDTPGAKA
jgi:hypothetical protein